MNYNHSEISGNITHDPETVRTKTGKLVCKFSVASNHFTKKGDTPQVSYVDVEAWEKLGEFCSTNLTKGKRLFVIGALRQDRWEDIDGKKRSKMKIVAREVMMLEPIATEKPVELQQAAV